MKHTVSYIIICALALTVAFGPQVFASEVTGNLSTDGQQTTTPEPSPTPSPTPSPSPTPTPTPNPSGENSGGNGNGNGNASTSPEISGEVTGGTDSTPSPSPTPTPAPTQNHYVYVADGSYNPPQQTPAPVQQETTTTDDGISDEEYARLALLPFGPRYGVSSSSDYSALTVGSTSGGGSSGLSGGGSDLNGIGGPDEDVPLYALVPRYGQSPLEVDSTDLTASAIGSASGLSVQQLLLIALAGLGVLASMGYAISRTTRTQA